MIDRFSESVVETNALGYAGKNRPHSGSFAFAAPRDAPLLKLISGEFRLKDAERFMKESNL